MKILFLARATLFKVYGGDTVQIISTAKYLQRLGISVDIKLANEQIDYKRYDLLHVFNIIRPADALKHINNSGLPYILSTIFLDYSEYQNLNGGIRSAFSRYLSPDQIEYIKTIARWIKNGEAVQSKRYLYSGHKKAVQYVANGAAYILPNSESEYRRFNDHYSIHRPYKVVYNGIDPEVFQAASDQRGIHDPLQVICVARIEGNKNQLNLIKALNNTSFKLKLIGKPAPNHISYYNTCKKNAASNISFEGFMSQEQLTKEYFSAKVHVLPSWNETTGLTSVEAAYHRCNIVITDKGDTVEYFGQDAWYCNPANPESIYNAIVQASEAQVNERLREKIINTYNWQQTAIETLSVYEEVLNKKHRQQVQKCKTSVHPEEEIKVTF